MSLVTRGTGPQCPMHSWTEDTEALSLSAHCTETSSYFLVLCSVHNTQGKIGITAAMGTPF